MLFIVIVNVSLLSSVGVRRGVRIKFVGGVVGGGGVVIVVATPGSVGAPVVLESKEGLQEPKEQRFPLDTGTCHQSQEHLQKRTD